MFDTALRDVQLIGPTSDHMEIRHWAQMHSAHPAQVEQQKHDGEPVVLRFVFGTTEQRELGPINLIEWDTFFALFDVLGLVLVGTGRPGRTRYELLRREAAPPAVDAADMV